MITPHEIDTLARELVAGALLGCDGPSETRRIIAEIIESEDLTPASAATLWRIVAGEATWMPLYRMEPANDPHDPIVDAAGRVVR
jgi:hypothetical protein